ncbi:cuticle protein 7-like [Penaeus monodon]|uniref:cuticle protein 7-like n=1 Tax=Penaeus monodon TaxID=6687 RepID=UPI0018A7E22E|nr:cuticle protein 7-like [Penaeus monodon]
MDSRLRNSPFYTCASPTYDHALLSVRWCPVCWESQPPPFPFWGPSFGEAAPVPIVNPAPSAAVVAPVSPVVKSAAIVAPAAPVAVAPVVKSTVPLTVVAPPEPLMAPAPPMPSLSVPHVGGQFHSQDEAGQYTFGHYGGPNTRVESRDYLGRTSGSFAYVDPEGDVQVRKYAAAPGSGFRVAASDLVEDTPAVAQVKSSLARAHQAARLLTASSVVTQM